MKFTSAALLIILIASGLSAQEIVQRKPADLQLLPRPQKIRASGQSVLFRGQEPLTVMANDDPDIQKVIHFLRRCLDKKFQGKSRLSINTTSHPLSHDFQINPVMIENGSVTDNDQYYRIRFDEEKKCLEISGTTQLALLYGTATFSEFFHSEESLIVLDLFEVDDWPDYRRRIYPAIPDPDHVDDLMAFALRYKFETIALPSRQYSWKTIDPIYAKVLDRIKAWLDSYGGPHIMQSYNIYAKDPIVISDPDDINSLKKTIETGIRSGADKLMILADDTPPFQFGEGYVLTDERDKTAFPHMAAAHCHLLSEIREWIRSNNYQIETYYVPAFYTYEDARLGDIFLYLNTPWETDAFTPFYRDLAYIGRHMPSGVFILWTGPYVRSRKITDADLNGWTALLKDRVPFLWDNTIYSHHPFTSTALFSAYKNQLPEDFQNKTAGNGMFVNGDANSEGMKVAVLTANDFLWQPATYDPEKALRLAISVEYGRELVEPLLAFKEVEMTLRRIAGERALWFQADTLWQEIIDSKTITGKNPFYYHLNYSRLKALRMQLKYSVPEPLSVQEFLEIRRNLAAKRKKILAQIESLHPGLCNYLQKIIISPE